MPKITQQQKDAVRADILNAARTIFVEKGFEAASMKDIVACSGRSFGGVYLYYSNKEEVFLDLLRSQYEHMKSDLVIQNPVSAWNSFERFLSEQERRVRDAGESLAPCMYEYFIVGRRDVKRRLFIDERHHAVYDSLFAIVEAGVQQGEFHPSQPVGGFVHWLISWLDGVFLESIISGPEGIELAKQFKLQKSICRTLLMPNGAEERK